MIILYQTKQNVESSNLTLQKSKKTIDIQKTF